MPLTKASPGRWFALAGLKGTVVPPSQSPGTVMVLSISIGLFDRSDPSIKLRAWRRWWTTSFAYGGKRFCNEVDGVVVESITGVPMMPISGNMSFVPARLLLKNVSLAGISCLCQ